MRRWAAATIAALMMTAAAACASEDPGTATRPSSSLAPTTSATADTSTSSTAPPPTAAPLAPGEAVTFPFPPEIRYTSRPLVAGDRMLVPVEGGLASFAPDGSLEWNAQFCDFSPLWADELRVVPGPVLTMVCNRRFFGVSPADGAVLWETSVFESHYLDAPGDDTTVVIESKDGIRVLDLATGAPRFERTFGPEQSRSDVADGVVFVGDGETNVVTAVDAMTGAERWSQGVDDMGLLVVDGPLVFVLGALDTITALDAGTGAPQWTSAPESRLQSASILGASGGRLLVTTGQDLLLAYDIASGALAWTFNEEDAGQITVTPWDATVLVGRGKQLHIIDAASGAVVRIDDDVSNQRLGVAPGRYVDARSSGLTVRALP